jgi:hypothetical protein
MVFTLPGTGLATEGKVIICHRSPYNPNTHKIMSISVNALPAHLAHGDNVVGEEVCNGVDDDCNGKVDEADPNLGALCRSGEGVSEFGTLRCQAGTLVCVRESPPTTDICNGLDDDC